MKALSVLARFNRLSVLLSFVFFFSIFVTSAYCEKTFPSFGYNSVGFLCPKSNITIYGPPEIVYQQRLEIEARLKILCSKLNEYLVEKRMFDVVIPGMGHPDAFLVYNVEMSGDIHQVNESVSRAEWNLINSRNGTIICNAESKPNTPRSESFSSMQRDGESRFAFEMRAQREREQWLRYQKNRETEYVNMWADAMKDDLQTFLNGCLERMSGD